MVVPKDALITIGMYLFIFIGTIIIISVWQRGFFWKYYKVKTSFGRLLMVKIRTSLRDYPEIGYIEDEFLVYKHKGEKHRLSMPKTNPIYTFISIKWIDVNEETGAICTPDYSTVSGLDAVKYNNIYTRALTAPQISDNTMKILIVISVIILLGVGAALYLSFHNYDVLNQLKISLPEMIKGMNATIIPARI